ncbi:MAG TPA: AI-2E family transporter [Streptosporangiaceae bacterium]|jgi:predicted PurR-regulated permease PerM|nr:AI-2E family transporter [Streptosporangiaceae bacterium]
MTGRSEQETGSADEAAAAPGPAGPDEEERVGKVTGEFLASPVSGAPPAGAGPAEPEVAATAGQAGAPEQPGGQAPDSGGPARAGGQGGLAEVAGRVRAAVAALLRRAKEQRAGPRRPPAPQPPDRTDGTDGTDGTDAQAGPPGPAAPPRDGAGRPEAAGVPRLLAQAAAWSWRILLVGLLIYVGFRVASTLRLVVLPCLAALLLTALLQPLTARLRRTGMPSLAATWCTIGAAVIVLAGLGTLAANRISADYPMLSKEVRHTAIEVRTSLAGPPFHLNSARIEAYSNQLVHFLNQHQSLVAGTVVTGGRIVLEVLTGLILTIFITFFLLKDGDRIWSWLISGLRPSARQRAGNAGAAAWSALVNYVRGTTVVASIHALIIGLALWLLGVPLLVPLVILVFLAAFVPLIGILVAGALAILVTLGTQGLLAALILLAVFVLENQVESHLLQPLVVGRIVRLHPLAIILVLAVGGIIAGIAGAIVAVPTAAALAHAWPHLRREPGPDGESGHGPPGSAPPAGAQAAPPADGPAGPGAAGAG